MNRIRIETLYGSSYVRPEMGVKFILPEPRNALEAFWWAVRPIWEEVIIPAFWFALAFTAFKFALFA